MPSSMKVETRKNLAMWGRMCLVFCRQVLASSSAFSMAVLPELWLEPKLRGRVELSRYWL